MTRWSDESPTKPLNPRLIAQRASESHRFAEPTTLGVVPARGLLAPLHLDSEPLARGSVEIVAVDEPLAIIPRATRSGTALAHESALEAAAHTIVHRRASSSEWAEANVAVDAVPFDDVHDTDNDPPRDGAGVELAGMEAPITTAPIAGNARSRYLWWIALAVAGIAAAAASYR